jgi:hypothetical protein
MPITHSAAAAAFAAALAIAALPPMAHAQLSETAAFASHLQNQYRIVPNITYLTANNWKESTVRNGPVALCWHPPRLVLGEQKQTTNKCSYRQVRSLHL